MRGLFITLEGPDGSGKSTVIKLLSTWLKEKNVEFITTREPGGTNIGEDIRKIILDKKNNSMSPQTEALLYAAARSQHVSEKILPALKEGKVVICERFVLSSLAYQGIGRDLGIDEVKKINDFATMGIEPDLILFFNVNPRYSLKRKTIRHGGDRLEKEGENFHQKVYEGYLKLLKIYPKNVKVIDAASTLEEVFYEVKESMKNILKGGGITK